MGGKIFNNQPTRITKLPTNKDLEQGTFRNKCEIPKKKND